MSSPFESAAAMSPIDAELSDHNELLTAQFIDHAAEEEDQSHQMTVTSVPAPAPVRSVPQPTMAQLAEQRALGMQARAGAARRGAPAPSPVPIAFSSGGSFKQARGSRSAAPSAPLPSDAASASALLHSAGALKTSKPDSVLAATGAALRTMTIPALQTLLARQRATLTNTRLLKALPDGGELVRRKVAEVEAALQEAIAKQEAELTQVDQMMKQVQIGSDEKEGASAAAASAAGGRAAIASPILGRGSAAAAASCSAAQMNARIAADAQRNIESSFRRPPLQVLPASEANALIRVKAADWHAAITDSFGLAAAFPNSANGVDAQSYGNNYRDNDAASMFDEDGEDGEDESCGPATQEESDFEDITSDLEAPE